MHVLMHHCHSSRRSVGQLSDRCQSLLTTLGANVQDEKSDRVLVALQDLLKYVECVLLKYRLVYTLLVLWKAFGSRWNPGRSSIAWNPLQNRKKSKKISNVATLVYLIA